MRLLHGAKNLLVVMQDNPDPDAIAAAAALRELANKIHVACSIAHGGSIGRGENRALVKYLDINLRPLGKTVPVKFDRIGMVDTQPGAGNNSLPADLLPHIVIDHHPIRRETRRARFFDIRSRYGATSTILWEYLRLASITPDPPLATALLYGIRSDTQDLCRMASNADVQATNQLFELANKRMLGHIQTGEVPTGYFQDLARALHNARLYGRAIVCDLGQVEHPDAMGEMADLLLRHPSADWTMCMGSVGRQLLFSLRTDTPGGKANLVAARVVGNWGAAGGHSEASGGRIDLRESKSSTRRARMAKLVCQRFLNAVGVGRERGRPLLDGQ